MNTNQAAANHENVVRAKNGWVMLGTDYRDFAGRHSLLATARQLAQPNGVSPVCLHGY
jgi:hypothetical protein